MGSAPTPTTRQDPAGIKLRNGYQTLVTISADADISFWEKTVSPSDMSGGGDMIDQTTMHNLTFMTKAPPALIELGPLSLTAAYDPDVNAQLIAIINLETTITLKYPDGSTEAFYGSVQNVEKADLANGEQPEMTVTIEQTAADPNDGTEQAPVFANVAGT